MSTPRRASPTGVTILAIILLASTVIMGVRSTTMASPSGVIRAVGAENQYADVLAQLGGRYVLVTAIMSNPSTDPHAYEASSRVAQAVASASLVVQNGAGYDSFMRKLEAATPSPRRTIVEAQSVLELPSSIQNPHLWYQPTTMTLVAARIERTLMLIEPQHRAYFHHRFVAFRAAMSSLESAITSFRTRFAGTRVATSEPVADYLLRALGLVNLTPYRFQADLMNGVDPSPVDISRQESLFSAHRVALFCFNAQVTSSVTVALRSFAERLRVPLVAVYETMPTPKYDYQTWMAAEIAALAGAITTGTTTAAL